jgi:uncharacterized protein (TIGR03083 family)
METGPRTWIAVLRHSHERLACLLTALSQDRLTAPSYDSEWTIAQVLSHLGSQADIFQHVLSAALSPDSSGVDRAVFPPIWDAWNSKSPGQQAAGCLPANDALISRLEQLSDAELAAISLDFLGMKLDATGLVRLRLREHAVHTWDVAVAIDPAAVVAPDAVALLAESLPALASRVGKPAGEAFRARLAGHYPETDLLLEVADAVTLAPWPGDSPAEPPPTQPPADGIAVRGGQAADRGTAAAGLRAARPRAHATRRRHRGRLAAGPDAGGLSRLLIPSVTRLAASRAQPHDRLIPLPPCP